MISLAGGCYGIAANVILANRRLTIVDYLPQAAIKLPCTDDQTAQDQWFSAFLAEGPKVTVDGRRLTLTSASGKRVELMDIEGPGGDTATTSMPPPATPTIGVPDPGGSSSSPVLPPGPTPGSVPPGGPAPSTTTTFPAIAQSADGRFFGHYWQASRMVDGGSDPGFSGAVVDTSRPGQVTVRGCNGASGGVRLDGDRLRVDGPWNRTAMGCVSTDGTDRSMQQDAWFDSFLRAEPTVSVSGRKATLTTSTATVHLRLP